MNKPRHIPLDILVDNRNSELWNFLCKYYTIIIEPCDEYKILTKPYSSTATVYVKTEKPDAASFAHELLHLLIHYQLKKRGLMCFLTEQTSRRATDILRNCNLEWDTDYKGALTNLMEHIAMFPLYTQMGYPKKKFTSDYATPIFGTKEARAICSTLRAKKRWRTYHKFSVTRYVGNYFAMKSAVNPAYDYGACLDIFRQTDTTLYQILEDFYAGWTQLNFADPKFSIGKVFEITDTFVKQLNKWCRWKIFVSR